MYNGMFIYDNVIHVPDMSDENVLETAGPWAVPSRDIMAEKALGFARHKARRQYQWSIEEAYDIVFRQSSTDLAMVQVVPLFDWYKNWFAPIDLAHRLAAAHPDRVQFCGGVDPAYRGLDYALESLEAQVNDMGAVSIKFYNAHITHPWRCDDEELAYPIYNRCRELGVKVIQFHKGYPFGLLNVETHSPVDIQKAARDFPDMTFIIHHLGIPYFEEMVWIANRFPNVYLSLSAVMTHYLLAPRLMQEHLGKLLMYVGAEKLLWGSEAAAAGPPEPYIRLLLDCEIPDDLREGYGYPQFTMSDKEKILGLNFARIMGVDVDAKKRELGLTG